MKDLLRIQTLNNIPVVDSRLVAEELGVEHQSLIKLIIKHLEIIEASFNLVGFEIIPRLPGTHGGGETKIAHLTEDQATFIATLSKNTERVVAFKAKLVKSFSQAKALANKIQQEPMSLLDIIKMQIQLMENNQKQLNEIKGDVEEIKDKLNLDTDYYALTAYLRHKGITNLIHPHMYSTIGKKLSTVSRQRNYAMRSAKHDLYDKVNTYHVDILDEIVPQYLIK